MVPHAQRLRARCLALAGAALAILASTFTNGCSRRQNLVDEPDGGRGITSVPRCDGGIPEVDSGVASEDRVACAERPLGDCVGSNDFPCEFDPWFQELATACQERATCRAGGCVEAQMGAEGCVTSIHMTEPDPDFVACLVEELGEYRCPCGETFARRYLGPSSGCRRPCGTGEHICPGGEVCVGGVCEPADAGGG